VLSEIYASTDTGEKSNSWLNFATLRDHNQAANLWINLLAQSYAKLEFLVDKCQSSINDFNQIMFFIKHEFFCWLTENSLCDATILLDITRFIIFLNTIHYQTNIVISGSAFVFYSKIFYAL
jgi:hypothetical protein